MLTSGSDSGCLSVSKQIESQEREMKAKVQQRSLNVLPLDVGFLLLL